MQLTTEQIKYVSDYIESKDIKWYELQVELTDHMVSSMEEIWEKDPELTFHQAKQYAENKFTGDSSFKSIEKEQTKVLRKEYNREQWKMIAAYLKFPKIISSILLLALTFKISLYFEEPRKFVAVLFLFLLFAAITIVYSYYKHRKIDGNRFLEIEMINPIPIIFGGFINLGLSLGSVFKEEINEYPLVLFLFCCLWALTVLFVITGIQLQNKTIKRIKKQYELN
ncbi:hypothetical protein [Flavobacterium sp. GP15]|uniref:hypothetical protein n=1 Tax=Flavobacterium sp. GP15 TaxID=2758567 RepID=UPI0021068A5D|nr:hypothetical protein [Flavobacterium sp. GP15]